MRIKGDKRVVVNLPNLFSVATTICLAVSSMMFSSCSQSAKETKVNLNSEAKQGEIDLSRQDEGVVINGVKWATRNVDKPGTFVTNPEDVGMFYQWNRKVAWATIGDITDWDKTVLEGIEWEKANDPSPSGWRVPTSGEIKLLFDTEKITNERTTQNGVNGRKFTDKITNNSIFLPVTGYRDGNGIINITLGGIYWGSGALGKYSAYVLQFGTDFAYWSDHPRYYGYCIRPVVE